MRALRADIVIATLALLISGGATISSLYQTKVIANQLSSSVWPYLTIDDDLFPDTYSLYVVNEGLGPALIRSVSLTVDGKRVATYRAGLRVFLRSKSFNHALLNVSFGSIGPTSVIRPSDKRVLVTIKGPIVRKFGDLTSRIALAMCYCSILDQCWNVTQSDTKPREQVASCAGHDALGF